MTAIVPSTRELVANPANYTTFLSMKFSLKFAILAAIITTGVLADNDHPYYCTTDLYCKEHYPGTVCIPVHNYGVSKCTPDTSKRPACRGAQSGLCPSYQSPDRGYLNAHCVFVPEDYLSTGSNVTSGSDSTRRLLTSPDSTSANSSTDSGSVAITVNSDADQQRGGDRPIRLPRNLRFACGSSESQEQCNYQGTCTYKNKTNITKRSCMCYAGFDGDKCETEVSNACDVDCGTGGDCVDNECVCKEGFDGKAYNGKKGNATERCTHCTNDLACKCNCAAGYSGDWCGAVEDSCTTRTDCGVGDCQVLSNGSSACYCPQCSPTCNICAMTGESSFDCSSCPTDAAEPLLPSKLVYVLTFITVMSINLAL